MAVLHGTLVAFERPHAYLSADHSPIA